MTPNEVADALYDMGIEMDRLAYETKRGTTHDIADSQSLRDGCVMFECEQCHEVFEFTEQDYLAVKFCPHCGRRIVHDF